MIEQRRKNWQFFYAHMVDFCKPGHIYIMCVGCTGLKVLTGYIRILSVTINWCTLQTCWWW